MSDFYDESMGEQPAPQPADPSASLASVLYGDMLDSRVSAAVSDAVDRGAVLPSQADEIARSLSRELNATGIDFAERGQLLKAISEPAPEGEAAGRAVGAANRALHDAFGAQAPKLLAEANEWLARVAPGIAASLAGSRAATDARIAVETVRAYLRRK